MKHVLTLGVALCCTLALLCHADEPHITVTIDTKKPGPIIHRNIYGQFMEHLGRGIYEGIWVGEKSRIPNKNGYRKDVLKALKELQVPLLRWPGGCFADEYHWQDGIGPRNQRKKTVNTTWGGVIDDNAFGTHEFLELAEMLEAEVYINGNLGTGTPREMAAWLEYMTSDSDSSLAMLRRANGRDKPWKIHYFAIGNESWGCGGNMTPQYYSDLYKHYATFLKTPADNRPILIASGGTEAETIWTETLVKNIKPSWSLRMDAISHHYYTLPTGNWEKHGAALNFSEHEWFSTLWQSLRIEKFIEDNIAVLDEHDPDKTIGLYIDEWGTWYDTMEGDNPGFLFQQNTLRDAVVAAVNLNVFHKYAERIHMSNIAQMVNVLQAMILTDKEKMLLTPTYHTFKMYIPFQDAKTLAYNITGSPDYTSNDKRIPGLSASAAESKDGKIWLSLVNPFPSKPLKLKVKANEPIKTAQGSILTAKHMDTHNTFDKPENIQPEAFSAKADKGELVLTLPAKSIVVVELK